MSIPVERGEPRRFYFKTAPLREGEGQGSLECVHQALVSPSALEHSVCLPLTICCVVHVFLTVMLVELLGCDGT